VQEPVSALIVEGATASFTVGVTGSPPMSFQWFKNGLAIPGANSPTHTTPPASAADHGAEFRVVIENFCGSVTSAPAVLQILLPPEIVVQPQSQVATNGDPVTWSVTAAGQGTLTYRWRFQGVEIPPRPRPPSRCPVCSPPMRASTTCASRTPRAP